MMRKAVSDLKYTSLKCLSSGLKYTFDEVNIETTLSLIPALHLMLQKRRRGMKATLTTDRARVMMEPDQVGAGHEVHWATIRPSRSHTLNTRKQPTGTKYLRYEEVTTMSCHSIHVSPLPRGVAAGCLGQTVVAGEHPKCHEKIKKNSQVKCPGAAEDTFKIHT